MRFRENFTISDLPSNLQEHWRGLDFSGKFMVGGYRGNHALFPAHYASYKEAYDARDAFPSIPHSILEDL